MAANQQILDEQLKVLQLSRSGKSHKEISQITGLSGTQVRRRMTGARKAERLDPHLLTKLQGRGITDLSALHSGWLIDKDENGAGQSLYFYLGPDEEKISFADAVRDALDDIPLAPLIPAPEIKGQGFANWLLVADLHVGGDYGDRYLEEDFNRSIDSLVSRMPPAEKAVLAELGDLLDANDHKGVTPASGNPCDVKRDEHLPNTQAAIRLMKRAAYRLAETHAEVEIHLIPGNHDPSAYIAVLLALEEHFRANPRIKVAVTNEPFRVIQWGKCAMFPNHGDKAKWKELKDVWAEVYADEWAYAKSYRLIATAHFHHDRAQDLVGAVGRQFRTLHRPNKWAKDLGLLSRGSLTAITVHKDRGPEHETISNILPEFPANPTGA